METCISNSSLRERKYLRKTKRDFSHWWCSFCFSDTADFKTRLSLCLNCSSLKGILISTSLCLLGTNVHVHVMLFVRTQVRGVHSPLPGWFDALPTARLPHISSRDHGRSASCPGARERLRHWVVTEFTPPPEVHTAPLSTASCHHAAHVSLGQPNATEFLHGAQKGLRGLWWFSSSLNHPMQ